MSYESGQIASAIRDQADATRELARATDRQACADERQAEELGRIAEALTASAFSDAATAVRAWSSSKWSGTLQSLWVSVGQMRKKRDDA